MEEKTPEQLKAIEEIRKPDNFPIWVIFVLIVIIFLFFWYLSRDNGGTRSNSSALKDTTTILHIESSPVI